MSEQQSLEIQKFSDVRGLWPQSYQAEGQYQDPITRLLYSLRSFNLVHKLI